MRKISLVFWDMRRQDYLLLRFTDLLKAQIANWSLIRAFRAASGPYVTLFEPFRMTRFQNLSSSMVLSELKQLLGQKSPKEIFSK